MGTTKVDLRIDDDLLETVRNIALKRFNAKVHHISHKPEVTGAINQLIRYGIEYLDKGYQDSDKVNPIVYPDNIVTKEALDNAIAEVKNELGQAKLWLHETSVTYEAIAELRNEFANKLGDFRSEVADTAITDGTMRSAIADLLTKTEFESAKDDIWAELTRLDSSVAMVGNYYEFTGNEEFFNQQENAAIAVDDGQNEPQVAGKEAESKINAIQGNLLDSSETGDLKVSGDKDEKRSVSCYTDLESLTTRELRPMARQARIQGSRTMSKPQLIEALQAKAEKTKLSAQ
jgi:hypothetical protein